MGPNWKSFLLGAAWRALKRAFLYGLGCGLLFLLMTYLLYEPLLTAEKLRGLFSIVPAAVLFSAYVLAGLAAGWYLGVTSSVAGETEETARLLCAYLKPVLQRLANESPAHRVKLPIPAAREALGRELNSVLLTTLPAGAVVRPVARFLEAKALGSFRNLSMTVLEDLERKGEREVTVEAVLEAAESRFPEIIGEEVKGHWRIGAYVIAACTAILFLAPALVLLVAG
jgi:hypothetical protein